MQTASDAHAQKVGALLERVALLNNHLEETAAQRIHDAAAASRSVAEVELKLAAAEADGNQLHAEQAQSIADLEVERGRLQSELAQLTTESDSMRSDIDLVGALLVELQAKLSDNERQLDDA